MNPLYKIINLKQGTSKWLAWRSQGLGASDAPAIMDESPWKTPTQLLKEKCGLAVKTGPNPAMLRGTALEPEARKSYEKAAGIRVFPACLQSRKEDWLRASLDGLSADGGAVVEIKCGNGVYRESASTGKVPGYYMGQLQHIRAITGLAVIDFWCYLPGRPEVHLRVNRDENYIARLLEQEYAFWQLVLKQRQ